MRKEPFVKVDGFVKSPTSILALGCAAPFVFLKYNKYESLLRICAPCQFYMIGGAFFFAIEI